MKTPIASVRIVLLAGLVACNPPAEDAGAETSEADQEVDQADELLVFSKTAGFRHSSIDVAVPAITALAEAHGVSVHATEDASVFTDESLGRFAAAVFVNTTGPLLDEAQQAAFERYIQNGGGYVGIHAASDINLFPAPEEPMDEWEWYNRLVGAVFNSHPEQQEASLIVADADHPATRMLGDPWVRFDEWYNFRELPDHANVLLRLDTDSFEGSEHPGEHAIAWYHEFDGGRAFYTGLGHTDESFTEDELFLEHLWGGIEYAMGVGAEMADGSD